MAKQATTSAKTKDKTSDKVKKKKGNENAPPVAITSTKSARKDASKSRKGDKPETQSIRDAQKEIEILKKQLELAVSASKKTKDTVDEKMLRPKGSFGSKRGGGQSIREAMGLNSEAERQIYKAIVYSAHDNAMKAGINFKLTYTQQDDENVAKFCRSMRKEHDILCKYKNNWAARAVLQQYITNRRRNEGRKEREKAKQNEKRLGKAKASEDIDEEQSAGESSSDDGVGLEPEPDIVPDSDDDDDDDAVAADDDDDDDDD
ncbi:hypothetical protein FA95DRAFT_1613226 [Auriscalpium vulgare]|uniref:Uncharacterized protein n=1 Tax=Auriscalpium vulgare TaxID=40419 RepID=A0ACB8R3S6_9AGAM|nr:hypothetical protein FA95DRAFT_1613226 [Auriscalpium vulgare]